MLGFLEYLRPKGLLLGFYQGGRGVARIVRGHKSGVCLVKVVFRGHCQGQVDVPPSSEVGCYRVGVVDKKSV